MNLYLDDDTAWGLLSTLLGQAGHNVETPAAVGMVGCKDAVHLAHAVRVNRVLLTQNYKDFQDLHDLVMAAQGHHPGILVIRKDNNPHRDLTPAGIVRAIARLEGAGVQIADNLHILNDWR
jgi:hypothetical protein